MLLRITIATLLAILCEAAQAADLQAKASVHDWAGFYVGGNLGYGWQPGPVDFGSGNAFSDAYFVGGFVPRSQDIHGSGLLGGAQVGVNYQTAGYVFGIEADISAAALKGDASTAVDAFPVTFASATQSRLDAFGTLRGRLGFTPWDSSLLYVTGGLAFGQAETSSSVVGINDFSSTTNCGNVAGLCASNAVKEWRTGWTIGGGWEQAFADHWSVKFEYLYYDLGRISYGFLDSASGAAFTASDELSGHIVRTGINYKF
ncbi:outer membrane protein [Hyphomicrobium sp. 2TAF46]|uniref:outer membrane protein n=1 Tax=Hyphomicrobium sp. 2TAF46 TaxID=3233019 RepID=UPI003F912ED1